MAGFGGSGRERIRKLDVNICGGKMPKKFFLLLMILVAILFFSHDCFSAPTFGTHMPEKRRWTCGLEGSFIVDRDLDSEEGGIDGKRFFFTACCGIFPWLSFDGKIGVGDVDWHRVGADDIDYGLGFAGGYGFRIKAYENEEWGIKSVAGFQHISVHPPAENQGATKHEAILDEWQGSVLISKDIGDFIPYLGLRYGTADYIKWVNEQDRKRIQSEEYYGAVIGMDYRINDATKINLEGAFLDGKEFAVGISHDF